MTEKQKVLIVVEGGIARSVSDDEPVEIVIVDWDVVDEGTTEEIQEYIDIVESLPRDYPHDRREMLDALREALADREEAGVEYS